MIQILSTKTLLDNQREALTNANLNVVEVDFIETKSQAFELNGINDNLIFTSQNAVQSFLLDPKSEDLKTKNVFCYSFQGTGSGCSNAKTSFILDFIFF